MTEIKVQSPTRVDLAGGTLDLWPLYLFIGGATTVNLAIDVWTRAELSVLPNGEIELISKDMGMHKKFSSLKECLADTDPKLDLLKVQLRYWQPNQGFRLETSSMSPVGGGLGGSSSLTISLLKAFEKFCGEKFRNTHHMVDVAHHIEAAVLNTPTGTQDYYPAASGGINILKYTCDGISQEVLNGDLYELSQRFLLVNTGKSHHSGINNFEVMKRAVSKDSKTMRALDVLARISTETAEVCRQSKWSELPALFREEFKWRVELAPEFSSPEIEKLHDLCLKAGAQAVKICGAGGGGCVLVWADASKRAQVADACTAGGFQVLNAKPVAALGTNL